MSRELVDDCVGCETCFGYCRYKNKYYQYYCDVCGEPVDEDDVIDVDGRDYCEECYQKEFGEDEEDE